MVRRKKLALGVQAAFTLVELLVALAIFAVITALVLVKHNSFSGGILLTNLAYETALTIRRAQAYGINVKGFGSSKFETWFGAHFEDGDRDFLIYAVPKGFSDPRYAGNKNCDATDPECVEKITIRKNMQIKDIFDISNPSSPVSVRTVDIYFTRPDPEANIRATTGVGQSNLSTVKIVLSTLDGSREKSVIVRKTGQISVE